MAVTEISHSQFCSLANPGSRCGPFCLCGPKTESKKVRNGESEQTVAELAFGINSLAGEEPL